MRRKTKSSRNNKSARGSRKKTRQKNARAGGERAAKPDTRRRRMYVPTSRGKVPATIRGSKQASQLGRYLATVGNFLRTDKTDGLSEFEGVVIANHTLITDPETLRALAQAGALQLEDIYATPETSS